MRVAVIIYRINYYRDMAPIVEEALRRGYETECWHDYGHMHGGFKGSLFPFVESAPRFVYGTPIFRRFYGVEGLVSLVRSHPPDSVLSTDPPPHSLKAVSRVPWHVMQRVFDHIFWTTEQVLDCDGIGVFSRYWLEMLVKRHPEHEAAIRRKTSIVGNPELDAVRFCP